MYDTHTCILVSNLDFRDGCAEKTWRKTSSGA